MNAVNTKRRRFPRWYQFLVAHAGALPGSRRLSDLGLRSARPKTGPWPEFTREIPQGLLTTPGIQRDPVKEREAFEKQGLHEFAQHWYNEVQWTVNVQREAIVGAGVKFANFLAFTRLAQAAKNARRVSSKGTASAAALQATAATSRELTEELRAFTKGLGLSAIGIAPLDKKYVYLEHQDNVCGDRMIVGILEQNSEQLAKAPNPGSQNATRYTYAFVIEALTAIAKFLQDRGYSAIVYDEAGGMVIQFAVQAGLGQLGMNGQLLTPQAGSRARLFMLNTNAPLEFDRPRDYGIPGLCSQCGVCASRCPSGAITRRPSEYRGITKWKAKTERCLPLVGAADGCAVCMKVCPVQKYGLEAVLDEYSQTGRILGKGTDELEAYVWPLDSLLYRTKERPHVDPAVIDAKGLNGVGKAFRGPVD